MKHLKPILLITLVMNVAGVILRVVLAAIWLGAVAINYIESKP